MLKIRLRRIGAIRQPHYRIVVADARAPRDGRFFEILGHYNPRTEPPTIQVDLAKYEDWKRKGAQPTDVVERLVKQYNRGKAADLAQPEAKRTRTSRRGAAAAGAAKGAAAVAEAEAPAESAVEPAASAGEAEAAASVDRTDEPVLEAATATPEGAAEGATDTDTAS
jgi:small subunit ribosomal protein S16